MPGEARMAISIVCQTEGWVVRKGPLCDTCYWYTPGSDKEVDAELPCGCENGRPSRSLAQNDHAASG